MSPCPAPISPLYQSHPAHAQLETSTRILRLSQCDPHSCFRTVFCPPTRRATYGPHAHVHAPPRVSPPHHASHLPTMCLTAPATPTALSLLSCCASEATPATPPHPPSEQGHHRHSGESHAPPTVPLLPHPSPPRSVACPPSRHLGRGQHVSVTLVTCLANHHHHAAPPP